MPGRKRSPWLWVGVAGLAVVGALFAGNALRMRGETGKADLRVPAAAESASIQARGEGPEATIRQPGFGMPDDVRAWLEHLKRIDQRRENYNTTFAGKLMGMVAGLQPGTYFEEEDALANEAERKNRAQGVVDEVDLFFVQLTRDFQALPPPPECTTIAAQYSAVLLETRGMIGDITTSITNLDLGGLERMQGTTFVRLDTKAQETNTSIDAICSKYNEPNKYEVFVDKNNGLGIGSAIFGTGGMGASGGIDPKAMERLANELLNEGIGQ